jgi:Protein of unknown function (DUF1580)
MRYGDPTGLGGRVTGTFNQRATGVAMTSDGTTGTADFFPLAEAARYFPRPGGKKVSLKTLYRWASRGVRKIRLQSIRLGQQVCTCEAWIEAFITDLNRTHDDAVGKPALSPTEAHRQELVRRQLDAIGI